MHGENRQRHQIGWTPRLQAVLADRNSGGPPASAQWRGQAGTAIRLQATLDPLGHESGVAQDAQVVGEGRLAQLETGFLDDLGAARLAVARQEADGS
jgi:hypothetical protein